jgi:type IV pilus assembly protein PilF
MAFKDPIKFFYLFCLLLVGGCGLVPNFSGDSMTNAEKAKLYMQMGMRYLDLNILDVAKEKLTLAARLDSGNADIRGALAAFYERIKDYPAAEDSYQAAVSKAPGNFNIKSNYGRFLCERGNYQQALAMLQDAVDQPMNNRQWFALSNLGHCYVLQNDLAHGEEYCRKALALQPEFAPALLEMQKISYQNRQYLSARAFLERYLSVAEQSPESLWYAFQTERALGDSATADGYSEQLLTSFPASKEAQEIRNVTGK